MGELARQLPSGSKRRAGQRLGPPPSNTSHRFKHERHTRKGHPRDWSWWHCTGAVAGVGGTIGSIEVGAVRSMQCRDVGSVFSRLGGSCASGRLPDGFALLCIQRISHGYFVIFIGGCWSRVYLGGQLVIVGQFTGLWSLEWAHKSVRWPALVSLANTWRMSTRLLKNANAD